MRTYYYGEPSRTLLRALLPIRRKAPWLRWPLAAVLVTCWILLLPVAWAFVRTGEVGHAIAGWCGLNSRDW